MCINMQAKKGAELYTLYLSDDKFFYMFYNNNRYDKKYQEWIK